MKRILAFTLLGILLLTTACSSGSSKKESDYDFPPTMRGTIEINGQQYDMAKGNYRWERKQGLETEVIQADAASPYQIAENLDAIRINKNETILINIEEESAINVYLWDENGRQKEVSINDKQFQAPESTGKYVYEVLAQWSNGEVSYTFVVEM
ncbi:hypothetical protein [Psychrobacillus sp. BM2]|uniref:hypothetical protein n=1 Tax=Psychrobacillus sp. BM2 TaxID=3400421 RepID=UPI003B0176D6